MPVASLDNDGLMLQLMVHKALSKMHGTVAPSTPHKNKKNPRHYHALMLDYISNMLQY